MQKRWVERDFNNTEAEAQLAEVLKVDRVLARLLTNRNVYTFDEAKCFFRPCLSMLHDPFLMKGMDKAIKRIQQALLNKEKILIYGDYDVDGTTAVALVYSFFSRIHFHIDYYIPDRYKEGYGISTEGIDYARQQGFGLIIALDCGIKSVDKVEYAQSLGIDFIICDHHFPGAEVPAAVAVLDPKQADCPYPYKELSGCGIGFKLVQAFASVNDIPADDIFCYLDLVAVSIASDIVPITGENRVLAYHGLKRLNDKPCHGLAALIEITGKREYTISDIIFTIGPRINASGRIGHARHSVSLLIAANKDTARDQSKLIDIKNDERKGHDMLITEEALAMIEANPALINRKTTVVYNEGWHKGVIGIVASRLTEKYYRPTVVLTQANGHVAGSARSVMGYDLYEALNACSDLLEQFGGHKYAAGLTIKPENIPLFEQRFEQVVASTITDNLLTQEIDIECELKLNNLSDKFFRILKQFAPFGPLNLSPVFLSRKVYACGEACVVGSNHLRMSIKQEGSAAYSCIGFGLGSMLPLVAGGKPFDICYTIEENIWKDKRSIQLNIKGIRSAS